MDSLCKLRVRSSVVKECIMSLNSLAKDKNVCVKWVKSHNDLTGNEVADAEAKAGALQGERTKIPVPMQEIKTTIRRKILDEWNACWQSLQGCRQTKIWFPNIEPGISKKLITLNREDLSLMIQVISGHCFRYHEAKVSGSEPTCRLCLEADESSWHVIAECPALWQQRADTLQTHFMESPEGNIHQILRMIKFDDKIREMMNPSTNP